MFSNKLQLRQHGRAQKKDFYNQNLPVMEQTLASQQQLTPALWHKLLHVMVPITTKDSDSTIHFPRPREGSVPCSREQTQSRTTQTGLAGVGESGDVTSENSNKSRQLFLLSSLGWQRDCARGDSAKDQIKTTPKKLLPF